MIKKGIIILFVLGLAITPFLAVNASDFGGSWAQATAFITKEFGLDLVARGIARQLLNGLVSGLINKIQTGGSDGGPAFVQNWRNFQTDSQYRGENVFRSILSSATLCGYASGGIKSLFSATGTSASGTSGTGTSGSGAVCTVSGDRSSCPSGSINSCTNPKCEGSGVSCNSNADCPLNPNTRDYAQCLGTCSGNTNSASGQNTRTGNFDPFALRSNCTMPPNFNPTSYQSDFSGNGGWSAWSRMLEPQNNYYGLLFGSLDEAARQRALEQSGDVNEAVGGSGYTSIRDTCAGEGANSKCVFMGKVFTPGDLLGKTAASTIDADLGWLVTSDELSEVIINIINASINRLANLAKSKVLDAYNNSPPAEDGKTDTFNQCSKACNGNQQCMLSCAQEVSDIVPNPEEPEPPPAEESPPGEDEVCASQEEIDQFLIANPGDEGRLSEAFPCS